MGVFLDYAFQFRGSQADLLARLRRLRTRLKKLPFHEVGPIRRVDPAYSGMPLKMLERAGFVFPPAVARRLKGKLGTSYDELCLYAAPPSFMCTPRKLQLEFTKPAAMFSRSTDLWSWHDLPDGLESFNWSCNRAYLAFELANVMLRHGYVMFIDPGEGCESFVIGLSSYRGVEPPLWLGNGFTKTQYAAQFVQCHEAICQALDICREEGLLLAAKDTCGFWKHRSWKKAAPIVNQETTAAQLFGGLIGAGIEAAQQAGVKIEDLSDPATRNYNRVELEDEDKPQKKG